MNYFFNRIIFIAIILTTGSISLKAQEAELSTADSLFSKQKYTEALKKYENIFRQNLASPAMLARMAFIEEGLGNYSESLYYLNLYFLKTSDKAALSKMRELAEQHGLQGYEYSDKRFLLNFLQKYQQEFLLVLLALSLFLLAYGFNKRRHQERPVTSLVFQIIVLILIGTYSNNLFFEKKAIIGNDHALLMTGPSAGAEPIDYIGKGNKVTVLKADELWTKISWNESEAYIRSKNLKML